MKKLFFLTALSTIFCFSAFTQDNPDLKKIEMCIMQQHPKKIPVSIEVSEEKILLEYNEARLDYLLGELDYVRDSESYYFVLIENVLFEEKRKGKRCHVILKMKNEQEKVFVFNNCEIARDLDDALHNVLNDLKN